MDARPSSDIAPTSVVATVRIEHEVAVLDGVAHAVGVRGVGMDAERPEVGGVEEHRTPECVAVGVAGELGCSSILPMSS